MKKIALAFAAVALTLALVEVVLRVTGYSPLRPQMVLAPNIASQVSAGVFASDPDLLWRETPPGGSNYGHPDRFLIPRGKLPAKGPKLRVLCLGDSCTRLTDEGAPYSVLLEQVLGPSRLEVFNASLPGYTSFQGRRWFERDLHALAPDVVVVYFGWNDHWRSAGFPDRELSRLMQPSRLRLLNLLRRPQTPPPLRVASEDYDANLRALAAGVAAAGGRTIVVLAPHHLTAEARPRFEQNRNILPADDPTRLHLAYLETARAAATAAGAEVLDAAAAFAALGAWSETLMRDGIHPTRVGHTILSELLAERLVARLGDRPAGLSDASLAWMALYQARVQKGRWDGALAAVRAAVASSPDNAGLRLNLAWALSTCPVDSLRDGAAALAALAPLLGTTPASPDLLDVEAAALAADGQLDKAAERMQRMLELSRGDPRTPAFRARLDAYRRGELGL